MRPMQLPRSARSSVPYRPVRRGWHWGPIAVSVRGEVEYGEAEWTLVVGEGIVYDSV